MELKRMFVFKNGRKGKSWKRRRKWRENLVLDLEVFG